MTKNQRKTIILFIPPESCCTQTEFILFKSCVFYLDLSVAILCPSIQNGIGAKLILNACKVILVEFARRKYLYIIFISDCDIKNTEIIKRGLKPF